MCVETVETYFDPTCLTLIPGSTPRKPTMQRKYNMALQHFYQAATHSTDDDDMKAKLKDLSGSEEDIFENEKLNEEFYEMKEITSDTNENNYFTYKKEMSVKRVKPVSICSWRGSTLLCIWFILFIFGVVSISYCLQIAINRIPHKNYITSHTHRHTKNKTITINLNHNYTEPCSDFKIEKVWINTYDKFRTQSSFRLVDINQDGIDDILYGFSTSLDGPPNLFSYSNIDKAREICKMHYNDTFPCFGGVIAINGTNGKQLWIHYSMHGITSVNCNGDLNKDGYADCLCSGYGGVFEAVSGKTGDLIWKFHDSEQINTLLDFFMPQFVNDLNGDGILDVLQLRGGHLLQKPTGKTDLIGKALFFSGKNGNVLATHVIAEGTVCHSSPVVYLGANKSAMVVYGTGDETHGGHLFVISLNDLYAGRLDKAEKVLTNEKKGFMIPPILVDVNGDGTVDIINAGFGDKIQAVDGITLKVIWTYHTSNSETYSIPGVGYYNKDDTVDLFVRVNTGSGYPVYYDSKVLFLDGKTGLPLNKPYKTSVPSHSSPLSVSMEGVGNDLFLYWSVDCIGHEHEGGWYNFVQGTDISDSMRYDSCFGRFGTKSSMKLYVTNEKTGFPGKPVYLSGDHINEDPRNKQNLLIQGAAIAPSLSGVKKRHALLNKFDVIFSTSYITAPNVRVIIPSDMSCIREYRERAKKGEIVNLVNKAFNRAKGIYDEGDTATNYCLSKRLNETTYDDPVSAKRKNFNNGRLTLYRYQITCTCKQGKDCVRVLPQKEQGWSGYMGTLSNGIFNKRPKGRFS